LRGSDKIMRVCKKRLGIEVGETTPDQQFTLSEVECLGACTNAPMVQINNDYYEDLDETHLCAIIDNLKEDKPVTVGSQIGRKASEPFGEGK